MLQNIKNGLRALFHRDQRNSEVNEELRDFLDASIADKVRNGMSPEDAQRYARAEMGSAETVRHKVWSAGWESTVDSLQQDIRYGLRQILKSPGISSVAILSLALGIGANTAIFTLINDLLLKQLPVRDPQQLVSFGEGVNGGQMEISGPGPFEVFTWEFYRRVSQQPNPFNGIIASGSFTNLISVRTGGDSPGAGSTGAATQAMGDLVSGNFFNVLGATPLLGRTFAAEDTAVNDRNPIAVISYLYWQQMLAADPSVIGRTIAINGTQFTVVGVMRPGFYGVELGERAPDMWLPITMQPEVTLEPTLLKPDGLFWIHIMARRNPRVPIAQAQSWVTSQLRQFLADRSGPRISADRRKEISGSFVPLLPGASGVSYIRSDYKVPLAVLMGIVGVVLLIACSNLANLLLAKAASREHEFSTRLALGSSRIRIMRQILVETLILSFLGGALGLGLAFAGTRALIGFVSHGSTISALTATPDLHVLAFTFAICLVTGLLFGTAPAWRGSHSAVGSTLNTRTTASASGRSARLLPRSLIVLQITLSLVLIAVAGLFLRTLHNLRSQDLGFNHTSVLLIQTNPKFAGYKSDELNPLYGRILARVDSLPGVRSAALSDDYPMDRGSWGSPIFIDGRPTAPREDVSTMLNRVTPNYFETLGIPLLRGRTIDATDAPGAPQAVVINEALADKYFPNSDPIGRTFRIADPSVPGTWHIVGVVGTTKHSSPADTPQPMAFVALDQIDGDDHYAYTLQILTTGDPAQITNEVRTALADVDPNLPILETKTFVQQVDSLIDEQKFVSQLSGVFSLLALALACIGLYGVMSYSVVRRTNEIGVRMALGATRSEVLWMILKESLLLLAIGVALGIPATLGASRVIQAGLFGIGPSDPLALISAVVIIAAVLLLAASLPARRATKIEPMIALRYE